MVKPQKSWYKNSFLTLLSSLIEVIPVFGRIFSVQEGEANEVKSAYYLHWVLLVAIITIYFHRLFSFLLKNTNWMMLLRETQKVRELLVFGAAVFLRVYLYANI